MPKPSTSEQVVSDGSAGLNEEVVSERSEQVLDRLFSDGPIESTVDEREDEQEEEQQEEAEQEEQQEEEEQEEEAQEEEEQEEDWDASTKKKKDDEEDDDDIKDESAARKQAKLKGREAKELKAKLTEKELEVERIKTELAEARQRVEEIEATRIKPEDHPEYVDLRDSILNDVRGGSELLSIPDPELVVQHFGYIIGDYHAMIGLPAAERAEARNALKASIVDKLKISEIPYAEMDEEDRRGYDGVVTDVLKIVQRNSDKTKELQKLHSTLTDKAKTGLLSTGVRQYENTVGEFKPVLDAIGVLADDVIDANPHAVESFVSKLVKESPEEAKRLEKAKADVLEVLVGPRALTQQEIDRLEAAGENVKEFIAERNKAHRAKQKKFAAMFVQGLMTRSKFKEIAAELASLKKEEESIDSELDALKSTKQKGGKPSATTETKRKNPLVDILGFAPDDD